MDEPRLCEASLAACVCKHVAGHEGPHECINETVCDGAWEWVEGVFVAVRMPMHKLASG